MTKKSVPSSCWQEDPQNITELPEAQGNPISDYRRHWHQNRRSCFLTDWFNYLLASLQPQEVIQHLDEIVRQTTGLKCLNWMYSLVLFWETTRVMNYNIIMRFAITNKYSKNPTAADLQQVCKYWCPAMGAQIKSQIQVVMDIVTNITFFVTEMWAYPLGRGTDFPTYSGCGFLRGKRSDLRVYLCRPLR